MPYASLMTPPLRLPALLPAVLLGALFAGCGDDAETPVRDADAGTCAPGTIGCICDDGACAIGRCADGLCVDCPAGTLRCPCQPGGGCADALVCTDGRCAEDDCPPGTADCPCGADDSCDDGLACMDSTCLPVPACPPASLDCPCDAGACDQPLVCINEVCRDCPPDVIGCPCLDGNCQAGLVCALGACREAITCADAGCDAFQLCEESSAGADARCLEACEATHAYDPETGRCVEVPPTCAPGAATSIADRCAAERRVCVDGIDGAACGPCLPGHLDDGGACVPDARAHCADDPDDPHGILADCEAAQRECVEFAGGANCGACLGALVDDPVIGTCRPLDAFPECDAPDDCAAGLVCSSRAPAADARCLPPACPPDETFDLGAARCTGRCACQGPGLTGRPWPVTDWNGDCICETEPGFFFNTAAGSRRAERCDADADGWVRRSAAVHIDSPDEAVRHNARCPLRTIDRVELVNEAGQRLALTVETLSGGLARFEPLYETDESDDEAETAERQADAYGARRFHAAELNPLTKACASALADFNDNGVSDLREHHRAAPGVQRDWMATFVGAGYFVELATGHYQPPAAGEAHGRYVVAERRRCDGALPVGYPADEGPYGAACWRRRDASYDAREPVGHDFARWSCAEPDGACAVQPAPAPPRSIDGVPPHGTCDDLDADALGAWRGMGHASQFKCVEIVEDAAPRLQPFHRRRGSLRLDAESAGRLTLNACALEACAGDDPDCVDSIAPADGANPAVPVMRCEADPALVIPNREALLGRVGFVALRFAPSDRASAYAGGCIDEQAEWPELCPGFDPAAPGATVGIGNPQNFGKIICGCGLNFGGPGCDVGCPDEQLHFGGTAPADRPGCVDGYCVSTADETGHDGGRSGFWMCADFAVTAYTEALPDIGHALHGEGALAPDAPRGVITVRGHIPTFGTDGTPLCQQIDEDGRCVGITLR